MSSKRPLETRYYDFHPIKDYGKKEAFSVGHAAIPESAVARAVYRMLSEPRILHVEIWLWGTEYICTLFKKKNGIEIVFREE